MDDIKYNRHMWSLYSAQPASKTMFETTQTHMACTYLDDIFIVQHVLLADLLRPMLH